MKTTKTNFAHAMLQHIAVAKTTQWAIAAQAGISHVSLSRIISRGHRPDPKTLAGLCRAMPNKIAAIDILCGHLSDEIQRAEYLQTDIAIIPDHDGHSAPDDVARALDRLGIVARRRKDVCKLLEMLAAVCEGLEATDAPHMMAPDNSQEKYDAHAKPRKTPAKTM